MNNYINPTRKLLYHIDRIAAIREGKQPPPVNVEIDLSNRCSLGCEWCHFAYTHTRGPLAGKTAVPDGKEPGGDLMNYDLALDIMRQLYRGGVESITWTGGGEPTLHPNFDAIIAACPLPQGIYTHGGHISPERARIMKRAMQWVYISLDECTAEAYQQSKGVNRFHAVMDGVTNLVSAKGDAVIGLGFMIHKGNYTYLPDMVVLGKRLGVDYVQFRPTIAYHHDNPSAAAEFTTWAREAARYIAAYEGNPFVHADSERFKMYAQWKRPYNTCYWTQLQSVITPNGKVWTCVNKREYAGECLGDLSVESWGDIWERSGACQVNNTCRLMCRGHLPNITLDKMMTEPTHSQFI